MKPTIGLFGTCGNSTWRKGFIAAYEAAGIQYFNPQVEDWKPEDAIKEAEHLVEDDIILFPVTSETYGSGSLGETGFSIMQAIRSNRNRFVVIMIDQLPDESLKSDLVAYKESVRARALISTHLKKVDYENVYIVSNMDELLKVSLKLHAVATTLAELRQFSTLK